MLSSAPETLALMSMMHSCIAADLERQHKEAALHGKGCALRSAGRSLHAPLLRWSCSRGSCVLPHCPLGVRAMPH